MLLSTRVNIIVSDNQVVRVKREISKPNSDTITVRGNFEIDVLKKQLQDSNVKILWIDSPISTEVAKALTEGLKGTNVTKFWTYNPILSTEVAKALKEGLKDTNVIEFWIALFRLLAS